MTFCGWETFGTLGSNTYQVKFIVVGCVRVLRTTYTTSFPGVIDLTAPFFPQHVLLEVSIRRAAHGSEAATYTMKIYLVSLLPPGVSESPIGFCRLLSLT